MSSTEAVRRICPFWMKMTSSKIFSIKPIFFTHQADIFHALRCYASRIRLTFIFLNAAYIFRNAEHVFPIEAFIFHIAGYNYHPTAKIQNIKCKTKYAQHFYVFLALISFPLKRWCVKMKQNDYNDINQARITRNTQIFLSLICVFCVIRA